MADTTRKVRIQIDTKADPAPIMAEAKALDAVATSIKKVEISWEEAGRANNIFNSSLKRTEATESELLASQQRLIARQNDAVEAITKTAGANKTATAGAGSLGQKIAQAGFQIQDFTVQVSSGTSALTAFAQQGSQLAGAFGPQGAIVGALLALGAVALKVFTETGESVEDAKKRAEGFASALQDLAKKLGQEEFNKFIGDLDNIAEREGDIYDGLTDQNQALRDQAKAQRAIQEEWRKAADAAIDYLEATNPKFNAKDARSALAADQRTAAKDSAIQEQVDKANAARDAYNKIFSEYNALQDREAELLQRRADLESKATPIRDKIANFQNLAQQNGNPDDFKGEIESLKADLAHIDEQLEGVNQSINVDLPKATQAIETKGFQMAKALDKVVSDTTTQIDLINQEFNAQESAVKAKEATEKVKDTAASLQNFVKDFEAIDPQQQAAKANITAALADGKLTADEMLTVTNALKILQGSLKTGQEGQRDNIQSLINLMASLIAINEQQAQQIQGLQERVGLPIKGR